MKYFVNGESNPYPNLISGVENPTHINNISLEGGANVGDILAGTNGVFKKISGNADKDKVLCIAAVDEEDTDTIITSAYFGGNFNIASLSFGSADISALEDNLRKSNIILSKNM